MTSVAVVPAGFAFFVPAPRLRYREQIHHGVGSDALLAGRPLDFFIAPVIVND
jgi:hypothetical protein